MTCCTFICCSTISDGCGGCTTRRCSTSGGTYTSTSTTSEIVIMAQLKATLRSYCNRNNIQLKNLLVNSNNS